MPTLPRRSGVLLNQANFDRELTRRGLTQHRLGEISGVHERTITRARHGHRIAERTLSAITAGLDQTPVLVGADLLIAEPVS